MSDDEFSFWKEYANKKGIGKYKKVSSKKFWQAQSKNLFIPENALIIGKDKDGLVKAYLPLEAFKTHIHIIGATGTGKSYFMEALLRDLFNRQCGATIIDPTGYLYHHILNYLSWFPELAQKVVLFNPAEQSNHYVGFNPLQQREYLPDIAVQVNFLTSAAAKVWEEDSKRTPLLRRIMGNMLYPLIEKELSILQSQRFTDFQDQQSRQRILQNISKPRVQKEWQLFESFSLPRKKDELGSLQNRLPEFVDNQAVQLTIGRTQNVLDFKDIVENQKILLVNLSQKENRLSADDGYMLGIWLIHELVNYTKTRDEQTAKEKPYFLFIDEFENFITPDVSTILDQCRKFGLHLILAHQNLAQLREKDPKLYHSVMQNARTKIIFGGLSWDDAQILEQEIFAGEHDLNQTKFEIYRTTVVGYQEESRTITHHGHSSGRGTSEQEYSSSTMADFAAEGQSETIDPSMTGIFKTPAIYQMNSASVGSQRGESSGRGSAQSGIEIDSQSESEVPILLPILAPELASRTPFPLEEQRYKKAVLLKTQPDQHAWIKVPGRQAEHVKIKTVVDFKQDKEKIDQLEQISQKNQNQYYLSEQKIKALIEQENQKIEGLEIKQPEPEKPPKKKKAADIISEQDFRE